jgi:hypothetical protein
MITFYWIYFTLTALWLAEEVFRDILLDKEFTEILEDFRKYRN